MQSKYIYIIACLITLFCFGMNGQENLVKNGNLSRWNSDNSLSYFSNIEHNPIEKVADRVDGNSNGYAAKVNVKDGKAGLIRQYIKGIIPGEKYKISFWYKDDETACGEMACAWRNNSANLTDDLKILRQRLSSSTQWTRIEIEIVAPEDAKEFVFALLASKKCSGGSVWYDDLEILRQ